VTSRFNAASSAFHEASFDEITVRFRDVAETAISPQTESPETHDVVRRCLGICLIAQRCDTESSSFYGRDTTRPLKAESLSFVLTAF
jgi:hypothetical protein